MQDHKNCGEMTEIEAKVKYVKLARSLPTYGVSFFLVKVRSLSSESPHQAGGVSTKSHSGREYMKQLHKLFLIQDWMYFSIGPSVAPGRYTNKRSIQVLLLEAICVPSRKAA